MDLNLTEQQLNFLLAVLNNLEKGEVSWFAPLPPYDKEILRTIIQDVEYWKRFKNQSA